MCHHILLLKETSKKEKLKSFSLSPSFYPWGKTKPARHQPRQDSKGVSIAVVRVGLGDGWNEAQGSRITVNKASGYSFGSQDSLRKSYGNYKM